MLKNYHTKIKGLVSGWLVLTTGLLAACGYPTPPVGGLTPYVLVVTPTASAAPTVNASPTVRPTNPAGLPTGQPSTASSGATPRPVISPTPVISADNKYTVQAGDTLLAIANKLKVDYAELVKINEIKDPNSLQIGQVLSLPSPKTIAVPTASPTPRS